MRQTDNEKRSLDDLELWKRFRLGSSAEVLALPLEPQTRAESPPTSAPVPTLGWTAGREGRGWTSPPRNVRLGPVGPHRPPLRVSGEGRVPQRALKGTGRRAGCDWEVGGWVKPAWLH